MNVLIVYAHPNPKSFCHAILEQVASQVVARGHQCVVHELYAKEFDPILDSKDFIAMGAGKQLDDVSAEQAAVKAADLIVFIHPIWWLGMPAILKGWIDRVMNHGFAYRYTKTGVESLLAGRKIAIISTAGNSESVYKETGYCEAINTVVEKGIFGFMGLDVVLERRFFAVPMVTHGERTAMLAVVAEDMERLL